MANYTSSLGIEQETQSSDVRIFLFTFSNFSWTSKNPIFPTTLLKFSFIGYHLYETTVILQNESNTNGESVVFAKESNLDPGTGPMLFHPKQT